ncbi:MAG TPA: glutathione S-transferase family protein [Coleofasciculaceae cyanobacterium]
MITLYTSPSLWGLPSISPACLELETWLRMAKLSYAPIVVTAANFELAPKGKVPFIDYQGKLIGDASLIIEIFKQTEGIDLDSRLTATEQAISLAFRRMLKENTYWGGIYIRYNMEENWRHYEEVVANILFPNALEETWRPFMKEFRQTILTQMYSHGMGRHSSEEIVQLTCADFQALSDFLADKPFFMGDKPTTLDATAYACVGNFIEPPYISPIVDDVLQRSNLCNHYKRMREQFFSDSVISAFKHQPCIA